MNKSNKPTTADILIQAKELISQPGAWIRWYGYGDGTVPEGSPEGPPKETNSGVISSLAKARQFCAFGAINRAAYDLKSSLQVNACAGRLLDRAADKLSKERYGVTIYKRPAQHGRRPGAHFNNIATGVEEVKGMFCEAIKLAVEAEAANGE